MLAAAAVYSAQLAVGASDPFSHTLSRHSGYTLDAIKDCSLHLGALWRKAANSSLTAVHKKVRRPRVPITWWLLGWARGLHCRGSKVGVHASSPHAHLPAAAAVATECLLPSPCSKPAVL